VFLVADVIAQVCAAQVVHGEEEVLVVLEGGVHVDQEGVGELPQDHAFVEY
jgi:hypothetical protein